MEKCGTNLALGGDTVSDATVFVGNYPFRDMASATWDETLEYLNGLGIAQIIVSPIEAVFQEDGHLSELRLAEQLSGCAQWVQFKTVDPVRPCWREELLDAMEKWPVRGIRFFSLYHGYSFSSGIADGVFEFAVEHRLPIQIFCRMQDIRMQYRMIATETSPEEMHYVQQRISGANTILFSGLNIRAMSDYVGNTAIGDNIFFDTSRLQGPWKTFETVRADLIEKHLVFGSLWPINSPECPLTQLRYSELATPVYEAVIHNNLERFLMLGCARAY